MKTFRNRFATDGRDKVYSILGLINSDEFNRYPPPQVDYSLSFIEVYALTTAYIIAFEENLRVLPGPTEPESDLNFPSWVVDWRLQSPIPLLDDLYEEGYKGSSRNKRNVVLYSDLVLSVNGHKIDRIQSIGDILPDHYPKETMPLEVYPWLCLVYCTIISDLCPATVDPFDPKLRFKMDNYPYTSGENLMSAFCRTIVADRGKYEPRCGTEGVRKIRTWLDLRDWRLTGDYFYRLPRLLFRHGFFITERGYFGMAPPKAQAGDCVYILQGGWTPIVCGRCRHQI
jgi:hypothetical protein